MNDRGELTLVPFLAIAATFEISFFIHMGIERVGRYLQVLYEPGRRGRSDIQLIGSPRQKINDRGFRNTGWA